MQRLTDRQRHKAFADIARRRRQARPYYNGKAQAHSDGIRYAQVRQGQTYEQALYSPRCVRASVYRNARSAPARRRDILRLKVRREDCKKRLKDL